MTEQELMVGDWVRMKGSKKPRQIKDHVGICNAYLYNSVSITSEMLLKNGFVVNSSNFFFPLEYHYSEFINDIDTADVIIRENYTNPDYEWSVEIRNPEVFSGKGFMNSVHELQHALKLCKIKKEIKL